MMTAQSSKGQTYAATLGYTVTNGQVDYAALVTANLSGPFVCDGSTPSLPFGTSGISVYRNGAASTLSAMVTRWTGRISKSSPAISASR